MLRAVGSLPVPARRVLFLRPDRVERRLDGAEVGQRRRAAFGLEDTLGLLDCMHHRIEAIGNSQRRRGPDDGVVARAQRSRRVVDVLVTARREDGARELLAREDHLEGRRDAEGIAGDQRVLLALEPMDHPFEILRCTLRPGAERIRPHRIQLPLESQEPIEEVACPPFRDTGREAVTDAEPPGLAIHELRVHPR